MKTNIIKTITLAFFSIFMLSSINMFAVSDTEHIDMMGEGNGYEERSLKPTYLDACIHHYINEINIEFFKAYEETIITVTGLQSGVVQTFTMTIKDQEEIRFQLQGDFLLGETCRLELKSKALGLRAYGNFVKRQ